MAKKAEKRPDFVAPSERAKLHVVESRLEVYQHLSPETVAEACREVARSLGL